MNVTNVEWLVRRNETKRLNCHASEVFDDLIQNYRICPRPIDVSFRELVGAISVNDLSHSIYPYPARLLRQIPRFFLHCEQLVRPGDVILDPFCGSGTVLVEAYVAQMIGWGIDKNPFARMLSKVKTTPINEGRAVQVALQVLERAKTLRGGMVPDVVNINLWFSPQVIRILGRLRRAVIEAAVSPEYEQFLLVCLALTADRCSLRDPRIPVPVRRRDWKIIAESQNSAVVWHTFETVAKNVAKRLSSLSTLPDTMSIVEGDDAILSGEVYSKCLAERIQRPTMILTSPPYGAAQKYIRSTCLSLGWTGLATPAELTVLERGLIGREHFHRHELESIHTTDPSFTYEISSVMSQNPLRAAIYAEYFRAMESAIENLVNLLLPGGFFVLIAGSNTVAGRVLETHRYLSNIAIRHGMTQLLELRDTIRGRVLMTKRASASSPLHCETIHVLRKNKETQ